MNTNALTTICQLGETKSFTLTAERIGVTQSAVSQVVSSIERELGFTLVVRSHKSSRLTPEGEVFYEYATKITHLLGDLERRLQSIRATASTTIDLMVTHSLGLHQLPSWLESFQKKFPAVTINIQYACNDEVHAAVMNNKVDMGLVTHPQRFPGLKIEVVQQDRLVLASHPNNPLAARSAVTMADLEGQRFAAWKEISLVRLLKKFPEARRHVFEPLWEFDEVDMVKAMVENNDSIAFLPETMIREEVIRKQVALIRLKDSGYAVPVAVIYWGTKNLNRSMKDLIQSLKRQ